MGDWGRGVGGLGGVKGRGHEGLGLGSGYCGLLVEIGGTGSKCISKMAALKHGARKFYEIPSEELTHLRHSYKVKKGKKVEELFTYIEQSCIGKDVMFTGPYGLRKGKLLPEFLDFLKSDRFIRSVKFSESLVFAELWSSFDFFFIAVTYCDYTASGR